MNETNLLAAIQDVLSGNEWDSHTSSEIADLLNDNGYLVDEYDFLPVDENFDYE